jgi:hypothetical protein
LLLNFGSAMNPSGDEDADFARFKQVYPRQEAMFDARKAWRQLRPDAVTVELIFQALEWQTQTPSWQQGFVPRADRWLKGRRWLDEPARPAERPFTASELEQAHAWKRAVHYCPHHPPCETAEACMARYIRKRLRLEAV